MPTPTTIVQHSNGSLNNSNQTTKRNKKQANLQRSKILSLLRLHDTLCGKSKRLHLQITRTQAAIQQYGRIQNLCTEISSFPIH